MPLQNPTRKKLILNTLQLFCHSESGSDATGTGEIDKPFLTPLGALAFASQKYDFQYGLTSRGTIQIRLQDSDTPYQGLEFSIWRGTDIQILGNSADRSKTKIYSPLGNSAGSLVLSQLEIVGRDIAGESQILRILGAGYVRCENCIFNGYNPTKRMIYLEEWSNLDIRDSLIRGGAYSWIDNYSSRVRILRATFENTPTFTYWLAIRQGGNIWIRNTNSINGGAAGTSAYVEKGANFIYSDLPDGMTAPFYET